MTHFEKTLNGYGSFFNKLPEIAFCPYIAIADANSSSGDYGDIGGLIAASIFAIPLLIPTAFTFTFAMALGLLAALSAPLALTGAAVFDVAEIAVSFCTH